MPKIEVTAEQVAIFEEQMEKAEVPEPAAHKLIEQSEKQVPMMAWTDFEGADKLRGWAGDVRRLRDTNESSEWELVGRALLLEVEREDQAILLARLCAHDAGVDFVLMDGDVFSKQSEEVLQEVSKLGNVLVYLSHSTWIAEPKHAHMYAELIASALRANRGLLLVAGTDNVGNVADTLRAPGVFDRSFLLPGFSAEKRGKIILSLIGEAICSPALLKETDKVGKLFGGKSIHSLGRFSLHLRRLNQREKQLIEFSDLIDIHLRDTSESDVSPADAKEVREQVAYHEAGHAAVGILDSDGKYVPEYASITGAAGFKGVVVTSLDAFHKFAGGFTSYWDFRHQVRISLGGRAAEELIYGAENVCTGASGDLTSATSMAIRMFSSVGFAPGMGTKGQSGSNLAVMVTESDLTSMARLYDLARQFLAEEYEATLSLLAKNRPLLDAIKDRLMIDPVVDQAEIREIIAKKIINT